MPPSDQVIVIGSSSDGQTSDHVYGPFPADRGKTVAGRLNDGQWYGMKWLTLPCRLLPGARRAPVTTRKATGTRTRTARTGAKEEGQQDG
jgi:hypothetical protein